MNFIEKYIFFSYTFSDDIWKFYKKFGFPFLSLRFEYRQLQCPNHKNYTKEYREKHLMIRYGKRIKDITFYIP